MRSALAVAVLALLIAACGGGDVEAAAGEPAVDGCADVDALAVPVVADRGDEDRDEDDARILAALEHVAADGPADRAADAAAVLAAADDATVDEREAALAAGERLVAWTADHCDVGDQVVWRCLDRSTFTTVGAAIEVPGVPPADGSPEEAVADTEAEGERVEVSRTAEVVAFAWVADDGLATRSETVAEHDDSWVTETASRCTAAEDLRFSRADGHVEDDTLPPAPGASSTSVP